MHHAPHTGGIMSKLIVVADAGRAVLLTQAKPNAFPDLVREIDNPAGRAMGRDLVTDRPGVHHDATTRHAYVPHTEPTDVEEERFARVVVERIEHDLGTNDSCVLVMSPRFLGRVRSVLHDGLKKRVEVEIAKDFAHLAMHELKTRVQDELKNA
jgi:protein required for attachment to host cells